MKPIVVEVYSEKLCLQRDEEGCVSLSIENPLTGLQLRALPAAAMAALLQELAAACLSPDFRLGPAMHELAQPFGSAIREWAPRAPARRT